MPRFESELKPVLDGLGKSYEAIAVDDGSTDGTLDALRALSRRWTNLVVLAHDENRGLGRALRTGFAAAGGEFVATLDSDLTFSPALLPEMIKKQEETSADLVGGNPFMGREAAPAVPWSRRLPSICINAFYRGLFSLSFGAYTPICRLYRREALKTLALTAEGFEINAEIAARFIQKKFRLIEIPAPLTVRQAGASKLRPWKELKAHAALILHLTLGAGG